MIDIATDPIIQSCPPGAAPLGDWLAETFPGRLTERQEQLVAVLRHEIECTDSLVGESGGEHRWNGRTEAIELRYTGMSFDEMADHVGCEPERIAQMFCRSDETVDATLQAERHIVSGDWDGEIKSLQDLTGLSYDTFHRSLLPALGVQTKAQKNLAGRGGLKYGPEVYDAIKRMRTVEGRSYGSIAKELAIPNRTTVARICNRRGWELPK